MNKFIGILLVLVVSSFASFGQMRNIKGFVKDSVTNQPIKAAKIINITQQKSVKTDANGFFTVDAVPTDFIFVGAPTYSYDTLSYSMIFLDTITILLASEGNVLPTIIVTSKYTKYQLDSILRKTEFTELQGTTYTLIEKNRGEGFGLSFNLDRIFKKKYRDKKQEEVLFNDLEMDEYVDYRFSPRLVSLYTGLKGSKLQTFIKKYNPGYAWLRKNTTNEDVLYYINDKLKEQR